jgi:hypothetical protein
VVRPGDVLLDLHFRREVMQPLAAAGDPVRLAVQALKLGDRDLRRLARLLATHPELAAVRAVHGLTVFHAVTGRYGFDALPVRGRLQERWFSWWLRQLVLRDRGAGCPSAEFRQYVESLSPRHVWISREAFIRRCAPAAPAARPAAPGTAPRPSPGRREGPPAG